MTETNRKVQTSVTCFLHHEDDYLFILRNAQKKVDPNRLNGVGGKVEPGENYLEAAIREVKEETGYIVTATDVSLSGVVRLEGGYQDDWVMVFFKIKVGTKEIPLGSKVADGQLLWLHRDEVLHNQYDRVDDLNYCFKEIVDGSKVFFASAKLDQNEKITDISLSKIER